MPPVTPQTTAKEILLEYIRVGSALKVIAVDPDTGTEVSFQAPANAGPAEIGRLAAQKLAYVLGKQAKT
jgi:hypothetical protein